jgi:hypothetical protein
MIQPGDSAMTAKITTNQPATAVITRPDSSDRVGLANEETLQEALERIENELGIERDTIRVLQPRWSQLMREGVIVALHISRWRAKSRLNWDDLGLKIAREEAEEAENLFNLGVKRLLPAELIKEADSIDSGARMALARLSYRTHWGYFVPVSAYAEVRQVLDEYRDRYMELRDRIVAEYDDIINQLRQAYYRQAKAGHSRMVTLTGDESIGPDEWATNLTNSVIGQIPSKEQIRNSFGFELELSFIPLPDLLAQEAAVAQAVREEMEERAAEHRVKLEVIEERKRTVQYAEEAKRQKAYAQLRAAESAAAARERMLAQMHRDVIEEARQKKEQIIDGFLADVKAQLHTLIHDVCINVLAALKTQGKVHGRHVVQLRNMVDTVAKLNFFGDADAEAAVAQVREKILACQSTSDMNAGEVSEVLRSISIVTRQELIGLGQQPQRIATVGSGRSQRELPVEDFGVPDRPDPLLSRQARISLRVGDLDSQPGIVPALSRQPRLAAVEG